MLGIASRHWRLLGLLGGAVFLLSAGPAGAQTTSKASTGSSLGGFGTSTGSSLGGSSLGGSSLGSSSMGSLGSTMGGGTGGTFGGTSGGYSGSTSTGGTGYRSGTGTGTTNVFPQVPSNSNPFRTTYYNPLAQGQSLTSVTSMLGTTNTVPSFGQPSVTSQTTVGTTSRGGTSASSSATGAGFTTAGMDRAPPYVTGLGFAAAVPGAAKASGDVARTLARSSKLSSRDNIQVTASADGRTVVLSGVVNDARDKRLAEGLARLTPGVHDVENRLQVLSAQ
jgi:hypothetical protein